MPVLQDLVSLSRRKVSFSFDKQHWHLQPEVQELGSGNSVWEKFWKIALDIYPIRSYVRSGLVVI